MSLRREEGDAGPGEDQILIRRRWLLGGVQLFDA